MKTIRLSFLSLFYLLTATMARAQWVQKASLPAAPRAMAATFTIGNKIYVCGGRDVNAGTIYQDTWEYDVAADTWTKKSNFGGGFRAGMVAFTIGSKAYVGLGTDRVNYFNDLWEYDPVLNSWTAKANLPASDREEAACFSIGNKGYVGTGQKFFSGNIAVTFDDFYEYDPAADAWTQKANFPGGVRTYAVGCSIGTKGYIGFGGNGAQTLSYDDLYEYNPAGDMWTPKSSLPGNVVADAGLFVIGSDLYLLGGINFSNFMLSDKCSRYNSLTNSWTAEAVFSGSGVSAQSVATVNGKAYAGTGFDQALDGRVDWWEFTPAATATVNTSVSNALPVTEPIHLYPNPVRDVLTVSMTGAGSAYGSSLYAYTITDLLGRTLVSGSLEKGKTASLELKLPEAMSKGLYVFTLRNAQGKTVSVQKIVKE